MAAAAQHGTITSLWTNGINAQQDEDGEVVVAPVSNGQGGYTYQVQTPSTNLAVGDILVGGINYNSDNGKNYAAFTASNFNVLFMSQITSISSNPTPGLFNINFGAASVSNWDNVVTSLGLGSVADKTAAGSVAILYSNPNSAFSYSNPGTLAQVFSTIYGGPGVTNLGELGFNGAMTGSGSSAVTLANSTGQEWNAVGPANLAGAQALTIGTALPGTNITIAIDPTSGFISTLPLAPLFIPPNATFGFSGGTADFSASETLAGTIGANSNLQLTSGGNAAFNLVPEPSSFALVGALLSGLAMLRVCRGRQRR